VAFTLLAGPAGAATAVSGDLDANAALVIDPASSPVDPVISDFDLAGHDSRVAFIQRMPVTKRVSKITLGDFASGTNCSSPASLTPVCGRTQWR
jgi:hypothetical protein